LDRHILFSLLEDRDDHAPPILSGVVYGCLVYLVMNFVVVPHSGVPHPPAAVTLASRVNAVLALIFCIGLPISLLTRKTLETR
jgi:hypothetical protein